jgi:NADPH:quinone reductase-like Zn-dependent oxidoreductase
VEGDAFCLTAANSALCKMVLQLHGLRKLNYKPVCIVRSRAAKAEVLALGAHSVIALEEATDLAAAVRAAAPGGLRAVFDALGGGPVVTTLTT